ncbi:RloB domain-containing protein [Solihabitans fulvus]|uniref:RloB domain-containing protein n=1 Tax=Solihabitans fulvus TaxID=1892852 RepID=A0A5B2X603_9PSEU|nr:RloB family protein [Solihabitans fulvus]KAA2258625.1 RloB domain-containing protein [Solihabitans fulvus]
MHRKVKSKVDSPENLVRYAVELRRHRDEEFDEVWCVVDVDEFDIERAAGLARRHGVQLAVSNPCFEYWLLLHFKDHVSFLDGYKGVRAVLGKYVSGYDKKLDFTLFEPKVEDAVRRAKDAGRIGQEHAVNPSTGVWRLVERVVDAP